MQMLSLTPNTAPDTALMLTCAVNNEDQELPDRRVNLSSRVARSSTITEMKSRTHQESAPQHHGEAPKAQLKFKDAGRETINSYKQRIEEIHGEAPKTQLKIKVANPVAKLDSDKMARIIWYKFHQDLTLPFLDIDLKYYDCSMEHRDAMGDKVTIEAAEAIKKCKVGIKCATITPDEGHIKEFGLQKIWYCYQNPAVDKAGNSRMTFTPNDGSAPQQWDTFRFLDGRGVGLAMYNTTKSISDFAHASFKMALKRKMPLYTSTKMHIHLLPLCQVSMHPQVAPQFHGGVVESRNLQSIDKVLKLMIDSTHTELHSTRMYWLDRRTHRTIIICLIKVIESGDTKLIHHVLLRLKSQLSSGDFFRIIQAPVSDVMLPPLRQTSNNRLRSTAKLAPARQYFSLVSNLLKAYAKEVDCDLLKGSQMTIGFSAYPTCF
ncbi:hypothetical protein NDA15_007110 [Ustilago hordei]|nr:hypothetical protein NDA15_007110 [Ustilago hordei]